MDDWKIFANGTEPYARSHPNPEGIGFSRSRLISGFKLRDDGLPSTTAVQVELPPHKQQDDSSAEPTVSKEVF